MHVGGSVWDWRSRSFFGDMRWHPERVSCIHPEIRRDDEQRKRRA
jgi:hypothetical protein